MSASTLPEIQEIARRIVESEGLELVDVELKTGRSRTLLRVLIDKSGGVTLDECESVSRQMSALLDVKDLVPSAYVLEVSSPGIDRPLVTERDFQRVIGRLLRVRFLDQNGIAQESTGTLISVKDDEILLEVDGREKRIDLRRLQRAIQEIVLGQPRKDLKKRKSK